ncbi:hypothetical protein GGS20DRAFT_550340 [Poronia punctata]|nr:hypothetical protein GGS20DRAFT_550340 [Poronia punctata]
MAPRYLPLQNLMFKGYVNGLRWETKGYKQHDDAGNLVHVHRDLLHHPYSSHVSKVLFRATGSRLKKVAAELLADIYNKGCEHIHLCGGMEPQDFWASAKNCWAWSSYFKDEAFWAMTYKLFHARALYLDTSPTNAAVEGNCLTSALDRFHDSFMRAYDAEAILIPLTGKFSRGGNEVTEDEYFICQHFNTECRQTREAYFGLSTPDSEGDGTDRIITTAVPDGDLSFDPNAATYMPRSRAPAEGPEDVKGFFESLGTDNPRFDRRDAYQEIEEMFRRAKEAEERERIQEMMDEKEENDKEDEDKNKEDGAGDVVMGDYNHEDGVGDAGFGNLGIHQ